jgi:hypothetical protein
MLWRYVKDTKRLAETSIEQLESAQTPFLALKMQATDFRAGAVSFSYQLENQGFGPALNVTGLFKCEPSEPHDLFGVTIAKGFSIPLEGTSRIYEGRFDYESLSEKRYATEINNIGFAKFIRVGPEKHK